MCIVYVNISLNHLQSVTPASVVMGTLGTSRSISTKSTSHPQTIINMVFLEITKATFVNNGMHKIHS